MCGIEQGPPVAEEVRLDSAQLTYDPDCICGCHEMLVKSLTGKVELTSAERQILIREVQDRAIPWEIEQSIYSEIEPSMIKTVLEKLEQDHTGMETGQ